MIIYRDWIQIKGLKKYVWEGWFIFGIVPIYLCRYDSAITESEEEDNATGL